MTDIDQVGAELQRLVQETSLSGVLDMLGTVCDKLSMEARAVGVEDFSRSRGLSKLANELERLAKSAEGIGH